MHSPFGRLLLALLPVISLAVDNAPAVQLIAGSQYRQRQIEPLP